MRPEVLKIYQAILIHDYKAFSRDWNGIPLVYLMSDPNGTLGSTNIVDTVHLIPEGWEPFEITGTIKIAGGFGVRKKR